jgi:hypothetical protein
MAGENAEHLPNVILLEGGGEAVREDFEIFESYHMKRKMN